jgi:hypothetical protein
VVTGAACAALALGASSDLGGRWTKNLTREYITPETPGIAGWLPEPGGILYSASQPVFYETFFRNPQAPWRYVLGYEATFMTTANLEIFRRIQWNFGAWEAYQPWVDALTPADRLVMRRPAGDRPALPRLEWRYVAAETWIGRIPRAPRALSGAYGSSLRNWRACSNSGSSTSAASASRRARGRSPKNLQTTARLKRACACLGRSASAVS